MHTTALAESTQHEHVCDACQPIYPMFTESSECHSCIHISSLASTEMNNVLGQSSTPFLEGSLENRNENILLCRLSGVSVWAII